MTTANITVKHVFIRADIVDEMIIVADFGTSHHQPTKFWYETLYKWVVKLSSDGHSKSHDIQLAFYLLLTLGKVFNDSANL